MDYSLYDNFALDYSHLVPEVARTYEYGCFELIVELKDGRIYSYYQVDHDITKISNGEPTDEDLKKIFGVKLNRMIWLRGFNQYDLARELGISGMTVSNYANGKTAPTFIQVQRMMKILRCGMNDLIFMNLKENNYGVLR